MTHLAPLAPLAVALASLASLSHPAFAGFEISDIPPPPGVDPQIGGLDFTPSGKLAAAFHRGEILILDPATLTWHLFARGLHEPLGIKAISDSEFYVVQRPEVTRISDTDGDGSADLFRTVSADFGLSGNYHEYAFGPALAPDGSLFISLNLASNKRGVFPEVRGRWSEVGLPRDSMTDGPDWKSFADGAGRMFSRVAYRGWIIRIDPVSGAAEPWCSGLRSPNGLCFDPAGELYVTDNQGDWLGTSKLYHARKGDFLGHPASLVWDNSWDGRDPLSVPDTELDSMRTRAAVLIPFSTVANSPTAPVVIPPGLPFAGQLICGEMNRPRILRFMLETVSGLRQGAVTTLIDGPPLNLGINRLAFAPDGSLYAGSTHLSWAGGEGIQRIRFPPSSPCAVLSAHLRDDDRGLDLTFTQKIDPASLATSSFEIRRFFFEYHAGYGSDEYGVASVPARSATLSPDGLTVSLDLGPMRPGFVYEIQHRNLATADADPVPDSLLCYTVRTLHDGSQPPSQVASVRVAARFRLIAAAAFALLCLLGLAFLRHRRNKTPAAYQPSDP